MSKYVFSAEHAVEQFLNKDGNETVLLANRNGEMALATKFLENEADVAIYTTNYPDSVNVDIKDAVSTGAVSDDYFLKLSEGFVPVEKESLLAKQAEELTNRVKTRPLFHDVVHDKLVLVH